jgi:hypothetical protein
MSLGPLAGYLALIRQQYGSPAPPVITTPAP